MENNRSSASLLVVIYRQICKSNNFWFFFLRFFFFFFFFFCVLVQKQPAEVFYKKSFRRATLLKNTLTLWILRSFQEHLFWRTSANDCFCWLKSKTPCDCLPSTFFSSKLRCVKSKAKFLKKRIEKTSNLPGHWCTENKYAKVRLLKTPAAAVLLFCYNVMASI